MDDFLKNERKRGDRPRWGAVDSLVSALREDRTDGAVHSIRQVYPGPALPYNFSHEGID